MAREIRTKKLERKVVELAKERREHFADVDTKIYDKINDRLNSARKELQKAYNFNARVRHLELLPERPVVGRFFTRYETISKAMKARIYQTFNPISGANVYIVDNNYVARNLKDAVAFCL